MFFTMQTIASDSCDPISEIDGIGGTSSPNYGVASDDIINSTPPAYEPVTVESKTTLSPRIPTDGEFPLNDENDDSGVEFGPYSKEEQDRNDTLERTLEIANGPSECYHYNAKEFNHYLNTIGTIFANAWKLNNQLAQNAHTDAQRISSTSLVFALRGMFSSSEVKKHLGELNAYTFEPTGYKAETNLTKAAQYARSLAWKVGRTFNVASALSEEKLSSLLKLCNIQEVAFRLYPGASSSSMSSSHTATVGSKRLAQSINSDEERNEFKVELKRLKEEQTAEQEIQIKRAQEERRIQRRLKPSTPREQPRLSLFFKPTPKQ